MTRAELLARLAELKPWLEAQGITRVRLFGSYARDEAGPDSDVDLLVDFAQGRAPSLFGLSRLRLDLITRLSLNVDLVPASAVKRHYRTVIMRDAVDA